MVSGCLWCSLMFRIYACEWEVKWGFFWNLVAFVKDSSNERLLPHFNCHFPGNYSFVPATSLRNFTNSSSDNFEFYHVTFRTYLWCYFIIHELMFNQFQASSSECAVLNLKWFRICNIFPLFWNKNETSWELRHFCLSGHSWKQKPSHKHHVFFRPILLS